MLPKFLGLVSRHRASPTCVLLLLRSLYPVKVPVMVTKSCSAKFWISATTPLNLQDLQMMTDTFCVSKVPAHFNR